MLIILDGWGHGQKDDTNAIYLASTPFIDNLYKHYPNSELVTHGEPVGLPDGQMGNSEVGHMNIGAGRIVDQQLMRINKALSPESIYSNKILKEIKDLADSGDKKIHILGLLSDGGVHSHINHFKHLVDYFRSNNLFIHAFSDGRDTSPNAGASYVTDLQQHCADDAVIASVCGRYFAMDRDKRWERIQPAYEAMVLGKGRPSTNLVDSINESYADDVTDEFILPIISVDKNGKPIGTIEPGDIVISVNYRTDRPRQIMEVLSQNDMPELDMKKLDCHFYTMTEYDKTFEGVTPIFTNTDIKDTLGEVLSRNNKRQIRMAETEKYPHVTFFFNGGREEPFPDEKRIMQPSPKVATYDLQPEMSADALTESIIQELENGSADFICLNFANTDMVGHTGVLSAAITAAEKVDGCCQEIVHSGLKNQYSFLITADHGNSDCMINEDGSPNTAHTTNLVPLFYVSKDAHKFTLKDGKLGDLAPTILHLMNIPIPQAMTGDILIQEHEA